MSELDSALRFSTVGDLEVTHVPDGYVIYDEHKGVVHYLNPTAALIFEVCDGSKTVAEIGELVRDAYDLDHDPSLDEFFVSLETSGLVCRTT